MKTFEIIQFAASERTVELYHFTVCGIVRHMDRSTFPGKLTGCFMPRFCRPELKGEA